MLDLVQADRIDRSTLDLARTDALYADDSAPSLTARLAVARALLQHGSESILPVLIPSVGASGHATSRAPSTPADA
jgi:hypothetical protein